MLTDKVRPVCDLEDPDPEDIFSAALGTIFTDDLNNSYGEPGARIVYKSTGFGDIELQCSNPENVDDRMLFSHYLWNSAVQVADFFERGEGLWDITGQHVLELGAGTGLAGIIAALAGAKEVVISDYPAPEILSTISTNVTKHVPRVQVVGHEWGVLTDEFSVSRKHSFSRVLAADCLWMPWQHENLARSILHFLSADDDARAFVIAGFHTGRLKVSGFFNIAAEEGLEVETIYEQDAEGNKREFVKEKPVGTEDKAMLKRWLVIAIMRRRR
ncbi:hypothetical protein L228DRAFT_283366 [Xylona heveae TC161]|uniref:Nicotinamide N-methyltransferase n=1 Tax=Xylona heveae (strain CBS 132557 / TC161) TaxID=1328760 RepID=A0A165GHL5_XYLHT|nr:hypothetical protein L228DRAFT_283366 [Xylona heveae TC161]KZF22194.1 hypothetical protein L228DRAFT_283366 [Xylona heveae TC161]